MDKVPSVSGLTLKMFLLKRWVHINGKVRIIEDDQLLHMYVQLLCTYVCTTLHSTYSIILPSMYRAVTVSLLLQALKLLHPTNCLQWYPVSTVVNSIKHKSPECMKKIDPECVPSHHSESGALVLIFTFITLLHILCLLFRLEVNSKQKTLKAWFGPKKTSSAGTSNISSETTPPEKKPKF